MFDAAWDEAHKLEAARRAITCEPVAAQAGDVTSLRVSQLLESRQDEKGRRIAELEAKLSSAERKAEQSEEDIRVVRQACESKVARFQAKLDAAAREVAPQRQELERLREIVAELEHCLESESKVLKLVESYRHAPRAYRKGVENLEAQR